MRILALNAGSSSHIAHVYDVTDRPPFEPPAPVWAKTVESASASFDDLLAAYDGPALDAAGHRVVHPGLSRVAQRAARIDSAVRADIAAAIPLAPGHNPLALEGIAAVARRYGDAFPQVAVFDTALGADAPALATAYAIPREWTERYGIRRLGFHGISQRDAIRRVARLAAAHGHSTSRVAVIHAGNGVSVAAFRDGVCIDHSMGMTPMEGAMMGTRSGSIDPGIIGWLVREHGLEIANVEHMLNAQSGLLGVSGSSYDTRDLDASRADGDERARFALDLYAYRLRREVSGIAASLGGLDAIAFTGPVAEHMATVRESVCSGLAFLGIVLDHNENARAVADVSIHRAESSVAIYVIRTLEEWAVAETTATHLT